MSGKILVVDDDPSARRILTLLLQTCGEVLEAATGDEALRIIEAERAMGAVEYITKPCRTKGRRASMANGRLGRRRSG